MRAFVCSVLLAFLGHSTAVFAADTDNAIAGTWLTEDGASRVQIMDEQGAFNGRVVWLKEPLFPANDREGMAGKPKVDRLNPDAARRSQPVIGLTVLSGVRAAGKDVWDGGTIYTPATGKSYPCKLTLTMDERLKLSVGGSVLGRTLTWTRVKTAPEAGAKPSS